MISGRAIAFSIGGAWFAAVAATLGGCVAMRPLASAEPPVVTEAKPAEPIEPAVAPGVPAQADAPQPLAARPEPKSAEEVAAIEAELLLLAERRSASSDRREIAALEARARELRRLAATAAGAGPLRP